MFKRFMNVLSIINWMILFGFVVGIIIDSFSKSDPKESLIYIFVVSAFWLFFAAIIFGINYIIYNKVTIWHKL